MNWKIGQKLVFIGNISGLPYGPGAVLIEGEIYTLASVNGRWITLKEVSTCYYLAIGFRPIVDIGDSVEDYILEQIKKEDLQTISV